MEKEEIKKRTEQAVEFLRSGYNCAQSVSMAYSDLYAIELNTLKVLAAPFGGGMGRLREVCGAVTGMFLILGLEYPVSDPANDEESKAIKKRNYLAVQHSALRFKDKMGSYVCADLLKIGRYPEKPEPEDRNAEYYSKRPCAYCVAVAAEILGEELSKGLDSEN
jgi:C_GCAxxG_C_C family probable redox protein